jgi:hypothetical protein
MVALHPRLENQDMGRTGHLEDLSPENPTSWNISQDVN